MAENKTTNATPKIKGIYAKLSHARADIANTPLKKSGVNKFAGYNYFELSDFLPTANRIFASYDLCAVFTLYTDVMADGTAREMAKLRIVDGDDDKEICFVSDVADAAVKGATPIQTLGSKHTYMRRYLWMEALELSENDMQDAQEPQKADKPAEAPKETKMVSRIPISPEQIQLISELYKKEEIEAMTHRLNHSRLGEWTAVEATKAISARKEKGNE